MCTETYGIAPEIIISGDRKSTIAYIPTHLDYMLYELVKNAMRYGDCFLEKHCMNGRLLQLLAEMVDGVMKKVKGAMEFYDATH